MSHHKELHIICPHCSHQYDTDDMLAWGNDDLFGLAPDEGTTHIQCPRCDGLFWVAGSYRPEYTTAIEEDDL